MKAAIYLFILLSFSISSCKKTEVLEGCIEETILSFQNEALCPSGSHVDQYLFQGVTTYVLVEGNCGADFQSEVQDSQCNTLGYLGGIAGNTQIDGEDFSTAQFVAFLWVQ